MHSLSRTARVVLSVAIASVAVIAGSAAGPATGAYALTETPIPGGDQLIAELWQPNGADSWSGSPTCTMVYSRLILFGVSPDYAVHMDNSTTISAFGYGSTWLTWRGASGDGHLEAHVSDQEDNSYTNISLMDGNVCIGTLTYAIGGHLTGSAYIPQEGGWFYAGDNLDD